MKSEKRILRLTVNGSGVEVAAEPRRLLLDLLRDDLGLTGLKKACDIQVCGSCTVLVNGAAVSACTYLAFDAEGAKVVTIEGLAENGRLDILQRAFIQYGAIQCGYCIPGMIMMARSLLNENPSPERRRNPALHVREPMPVHGLQEDRRGHPGRCWGRRDVRNAGPGFLSLRGG